jgi:AcrR family transcriptional regulator
MPRTQQQRREETIARLLDASIDTIIEFGYARTSAALITKRAQVSEGALFRHFPTMRDLMAATLREAGRRQLELYASRIAQAPAGPPAPEAVLPIVRDITRNPTHGVIYELALPRAPMRSCAPP